MMPEDYQAWKEARARVEVPDGFSDRVMQNIASEKAAGDKPRPTEPPPTPSRSVVRYILVGSCLVMCFGLGVLRIGSFVAINLLLKSEAI